MMKLVVLCCVFAAVAAQVPYYAAPVGITVPSPYGYAVPLPLAYNPAHIAIRNLDSGFHSLKKRSVTRLAVAPGPIGFSAAAAAGNIGTTAPFTINPTGFSAAIATNPIGISAPLTSVPFGISTPFVAGAAGISSPIGGIFSPINTSPLSFPSPIAVSAPVNTGSALETSPIAVGSTGVPASAVPVVRNF